MASYDAMMMLAARREAAFDGMNVTGELFDCVTLSEYHDLAWNLVFDGTCFNMCHVPDVLCIDNTCTGQSFDASVLCKKRTKAATVAIECEVEHELLGQFKVVLCKPAFEAVFCPTSQAVAQHAREARIKAARDNVVPLSSQEKFWGKVAEAANNQPQKPKKKGLLKKVFG